MKRLPLLLLSVVLFSCCAYAWPEPKFCNGIDCPEFSTIFTNGTFTVRHYLSSKWSRTNVTNIDFGDAEMLGFKKLFAYISGANKDKKEIPMAAPVQEKVFPGAGPACKTTFITGFFVPFKFQDNTPEPTDPDVYLYEAPPVTRAIVSFGGYTTNFKDDVLPHIQHLVETLSYYKQSFDPNVYSVSGYDSPYRVFDRHNEIWIDLPNGWTGPTGNVM